MLSIRHWRLAIGRPGAAILLPCVAIPSRAPNAERRKKIFPSQTINTGAAPAEAISTQAGPSLGEYERLGIVSFCRRGICSTLLDTDIAFLDDSAPFSDFRFDVFAELGGAHLDGRCALVGKFPLQFGSFKRRLNIVMQFFDDV